MQHARRLRTATSAAVAVAVTVLTGLSWSTPAMAVPAAGSSTPATAPATTPTTDPSTSPKTIPPGPSEPLCGATLDPTQAVCMSLVRTDVSGPVGMLAPGSSPTGYGPADLQDAYNLPSATAGAGQTVAIIDAFDAPTAETDLTIYRAQYGLPACTTANGCFRKVDQRGGTDYPVPSANWAAEISVDIDMVSAVCPLCHILLVEADSTAPANVYAAVNEAVALGAKYVSNSYGFPETSGQTTDDEQVFNHPGVVITASSGDNGFGVSYPATSRYVTAVGGTTLTPATDNARGWDEEAWSDAGSGCSQFETKPAFQHDPDCARRTVADVSAVADPNTGVAAYDTYKNPGWMVIGGTSVASPIIASTYALAARVGATDYPNSYPYAVPGEFNDITVGSNGNCGENYQCTAKVGYDGPSGLGTPNGVLGFGEISPHGMITGTVSDTGGQPLADAQVTAGDISTTTDSQGHYTLALPVGSYDMTVTAFGHNGTSSAGVAVTDGGTTTRNFTLTAQQTVTISGRVTDGSGHAWPLYSSIQVLGTSVHPVFTDPFTGNYHLTLPANATYTFQVVAQYPGYQADRVPVQVGTSNVTHDIAVPVDPVTCTAPGYGFTYTGLPVQPFDGGAVPTGWTVTDATGGGPWAFNDPGGEGNRTGGTGGFAIVDSDFYGSGKVQDTSLISPPIDLSTATTPDIGFNTDFVRFVDSIADVDLSLDGGSTWTTMWERTTTSVTGPVFETIPIPQAAGHANVRVRFRYRDDFGEFWQVDNVYVGDRGCGPTTAGGLVAGQVTDANTGNPVAGATVTSADQPSTTTTSAATTDPAVGDGWYWLFSSLTGSHPLTASRTAYQSVTGTATITANAIAQTNLALKAGHVTIDDSTVSATQTMGTSTTHPITITNDGTAPATVTLSETGGASAVLTQQGAPLEEHAGTFSPLSVIAAPPPTGTATPDAFPHNGPWAPVADYPTPVMDNAVGVAADGRVYSFGGVQGPTGAPAASAVYDPATQTWSPIAEMTTRREKPSVAYLAGRFYLFGGWNLTTGAVVASTEVYDPATNTWSTAAANPRPHAATAVTVVGSTVYVVGGCDATRCGSTDVMVYHQSTNTWTQTTSYPQPISWSGCGTITGKVYCAGGNTGFGGLTKGYVLDPATNTWSPIPDLPVDEWGMGATGADGMLVLTGGVINGSSVVTNQGYAYDPTVGAWTNLPNANHAVYRAGTACGLYTVGGSIKDFNAIAQGNILPGFDGCDGTANVTWLTEDASSFTLAPGASRTVTTTFDAATPTLNQPVTYNAQLAVDTNTPYEVNPVTLTMDVTAPASWSRVIGTVVGTNCSGSVIPLTGATLTATFHGSVFTINTDDTSNYGLWLAEPPGLFTVTATKAGWQPETVSTQVNSGELDVTILASTPTTSCS